MQSPGPWSSQNVEGQIRHNWEDLPSLVDVVRDYLPMIRKHCEMYRKPGKPPGDPEGDVEGIPDEWWSKSYSPYPRPVLFFLRYKEERKRECGILTYCENRKARHILDKTRNNALRMHPGPLRNLRAHPSSIQKTKGNRIGIAL